MRFGILGSGDVAKSLGSGLVQHGHSVVLGTREPDKLGSWSEDKHVSVGTLADAAGFGDIIILATHGKGTRNAIMLAGTERFSGKIVIDATNPLDFSKSMPPTLSVGTTDSLGEQAQRLLSDARVVKCYNTVGHAHMIDPKFAQRPDMFICGNDEKAKKEVEKLLASVGWGCVDIGDITCSRYLEPLAMVWISYGFHTNTWNHAIKLLRQ